MLVVHESFREGIGYSVSVIRQLAHSDLQSHRQIGYSKHVRRHKMPIHAPLHDARNAVPARTS